MQLLNSFLRIKHIRASILAAVAWLACGPVAASLIISADNQKSSLTFTPTWAVATNNLLRGLSLTSSSGDFQVNNTGGLTTLTDGLIGPIRTNGSVSVYAPYAGAGNAAGGSSATYTLPASTYGYNLTNITVFSGWPDAGRDAQRYRLYYSTVSFSAAFTLLADVDYNPAGIGSIPTANRVVLADSAGGIIASNVYALRFDFTPAVENGWVGYTEITANGAPATSAVLPPIMVTSQTQTVAAGAAPTWVVETNSLIAGQQPAFTGNGSFANEGGPGLANLTDGRFGVVNNLSGYATCGSLGGVSADYFLNGATVTNIIVYSGWQDAGRDGQFYNVYYSTMAEPATYYILTSVALNPPVSGIPANRVMISPTSATSLATNVAFLRFDFSVQDNTSASDYGYSGYAEIVVQGNNSASSATGDTSLFSPSAPTSSPFGADAALTFNEIMYHPATSEALFEWIEFYNQLAVDLDISGWRVDGDTEFTFPAGTRVAGRSYIVLARNPANMMEVTGMSSNVFGPFVSPLNNNGGTLNLHNNAGRLMDTISFGTSGDWPVTADWAGPSLAKIDRDWGSAAPQNWRASQQAGGTPGTENFPMLVPPASISFNEVAGTTNSSFWLELYNYGTSAVSLANCILHHDGATNTDYQFSSGATIAPSSFMVLSNSTLGFISPASGDKIFLFAPGRTNAYDGLVLKNRSHGRYPDGTGNLMIPNAPTPGASNSVVFRSELVINEIMYKHKEFPAVDTNSLPKDNPEEWLEIYNRSKNTVDLTGWTLSGGISYDFTSVSTIAPNGYLVVARDVATLKSQHPSIDIVGGYSGHLSSEDVVTLSDPLGNVANQVHYYSGGRWPEYAQGGGPSLELRNPNDDNSKAEAWLTSIEAGNSKWQTYTYRMTAQSSTTSAPDSQWQDFVMGLLSAGECWVDDITVTRSPSTNPMQLISNGDFENGMTGWRVLGNHRTTTVEVDPSSAGNHVLHIVATGPQEHMHNHIEQTLPQSITNGVEYQISFRARWIAGNSLLNTRLYFDRAALTTALLVPQANGTPGAVNSTYTSNIGPTYSQFQHQPVVPLANQPVSVFVCAQDPQGVTNCSVWWSVSGGPWNSTAMTATNGVFVGTTPGQPSGALVQFYVRGVDGAGTSSTYPAKGINSGAFYRVNDGAAFVSLSHNLRILMSPANIAFQLAMTNLMSNENLPCTVIYDERYAYYDMGVRLKSSERGRVDQNRIGFHLQFNPDDLFRGVHPVMLFDRSPGGGRPPNEDILIKHMLLHAGIPMVNSDITRVIAPQSAISGTGLLFPRYEDNFVATTYTNGASGNLFEFELTYYPTTADSGGYKLPTPDNVQGVDISDQGNEKERYRYNFILKNHRDLDDYSILINTAKKFSFTSTQLEAQTRSVIDVDQWLRAYAMISLCGVSDMYTFGGEHNWMFYVRPDDRRVIYFPWDMDFSFTQSSSASLVGNDTWSNVVNLPANLRRFYAYILDHINTTYNSSYMSYWVNYYAGKAGQNYSGDLPYVAARSSYAMTVITNAGGFTPFSMSSGTTITTANNLVTLSGNAPVSIASLLINGVAYPVTWNSIYSWTVQVPLPSATNAIAVQGYDINGKLVTNITRTAIYTGIRTNPTNSIVFNEIMYRPARTNAEFVEIRNNSTNFSFDLSGWRTNGLGYTFPSGSLLASNSYLVLAKNRFAFADTYGINTPLFDEFSGSLDPDGETLTLFMPNSADTNQELVVDRVHYEPSSPWPSPASGSSLQLIDPTQDNSRSANWTAANTNATVAPQWVRVTATGVPQSSSGSRPLYIYLQSAGDIYIDDVSVVLGSSAETGVNVVTNGGFESSLTSWTIGSSGNNSASVSATNYAHSGSRSLHIIASSGGTTQSSAIWQDFSSSLTVGATYTLSFWYLQSTNGGPLTLRFSGSGVSATISPAPAPGTSQPATPSAANSVATTMTAFPTLWLNEAQSSNITGATNSAGTRVPWVELHNPGTNAASLSGLYLSTNDVNLTAWAFPANVSVPSNGYLIVWCDGQTNLTTTNALHSSFTLAANTGAVRLSRIVSGMVQVVDYLNYTNLPANWSYGDFPDGQPFYRQQMFATTPGTTNSSAVAPISVSINEFMADNTHTISNPVGGKFDDWFELFNYGANTVDLGGYYLTGTLTNTSKFLIQNNHQYLIPPQGFILVWADNQSGSNATNRPELHTNFKLSKSGEQIGLFCSDGSMIDGLTFGAQTSDVSQGRFPDAGVNWFPMPLPTPQTNNLIPNTAPSLAAISDIYAYAGQTVQFSATATDTESAVQTLTFSLSNAPDGAAISPATGIFTWSTTIPGTNTFTVRVTDNGTPALSTSMTFNVFVYCSPRFTSLSLGSGKTIQISFDTLTGQTYQLQVKNEIGDSTWKQLVIVSGTGLPTTVTDDIPEHASRFYRLLIQPQ